MDRAIWLSRWNHFLPWRTLSALVLGLFLGGVLSLAAAPVSPKKPPSTSSPTPVPGVVPVGSVVAFAGYVPPPGWLICDGALLPIVDYPDLFQTLVFAHGRSDDGTRFRLPDYRGLFLRGVDQGSGHDPDATNRKAPGRGASEGDAVGSLQGDSVAAHSHNLPEGEVKGKKRFGGNSQRSLGGEDTEITEDSPATAMVGGGETRPRNSAVYWIIRAR